MTLAVDLTWMQRALAQAQLAARANEVPVGAVVVMDGRVVGEGHNQCLGQHDPSAHAEVIALRAAAELLGQYRLTGATLYVTLEPCVMCVGALVNARVERVVFGAREPKTGAVLSAFDLLMSDKHNHRVAITEGVLAEDCAAMISGFFSERRHNDR